MDLEYKLNEDLIMLSIDAFLQMFAMASSSRTQNGTPSTPSKKTNSPGLPFNIREVAHLFAREGLIPRLAALVPKLINHAETSTVLQDQSNAEKYLERTFDLL